MEPSYVTESVFNEATKRIDNENHHQNHRNLWIGEEKPQDEEIDEIAREVIAGKWGNGAERRRRLISAGYNPTIIQSRVNALLKK